MLFIQIILIDSETAIKIILCFKQVFVSLVLNLFLTKCILKFSPNLVHNYYRFLILTDPPLFYKAHTVINASFHDDYFLSICCIL